MPDLLDAKLIWFLAGILLILAEFVAPGVVIVFFGVGAVITSITTWAGLTPGIGSQAAVFGLSSVVLLFTLRRYVRQWFVGKSADFDGDLDDDFTGREARVVKDIPGHGLDGRVEIKGAEWKARSEAAIPAGTTVVIERRDGLTLHVRQR
jgi:membrane protein implicated in regulation of membrane protease activity